MKLISNDLRASCRAMLIQSYDSGGSSENKNEIYHHILDNMKVYNEKQLTDSYKAVFALVITDRVAGMLNGKIKDYNYNNSIEGVIYQYPLPQETLLAVSVIYKDNAPLYCSVNNVRNVGLNQLNYARIYTDDTFKNYYNMAYYYSKYDYASLTIDSAEVDISPKMSYAFEGTYTGTHSVTFTVNGKQYEYRQPVNDNGNMVPGVGTVEYSTDVPYSSTASGFYTQVTQSPYGTYSDLDDAELEAECAALRIAVSAAEGVTCIKPEIIRPTE